MARDTGSKSPSDVDSLDPADVARAEAKTRVMTEEEAGLPPAQSDDAEAATVLADEDDRTHLVERERVVEETDETDKTDEPDNPGDAAQVDALAPTRVLDAAEPPSPPRAVERTAETRVLDLPEDKTSPPRVAESNPNLSGQAPPPPTPIDSSLGLPAGMILFGEYEIVNVLGVGGMGEVYRARHRRLDEHRAIKVMHAELSKKKGAAEFFYREAKALLAVRHPAVVHCHDLLSDEEGRVYLIMEMIEGIPLSKKMNDGPLSPDDVAVLGARVSHGLSAAHRKGVIHRDVSPDNIVLPNGRVQEAKLIDFGIAKILQQGEGTIVDGFKGKLSYASPEQLGFFGGKIDGSSDFYSLGLVLVAAALGRPMGMGTTVMEAVDARRSFESLPDEIPIGLRSAIQPLLALDPKDRPKYVDRLFVVPGGTEGATDPGRFARGDGGSQGQSSASIAGNRVGLFAGIGAAAAVAIGAGFYFLSASQPSTTTATATPGPPIVETSITATGIPSASVAEIETPAARITAPAAAEPVVVAKTGPAKPKVRRLTASDRIKIIGLLSGAKLALGENRLMSPANDNAYDRYRKILALEPNNVKAKNGLREVAGRYVSLTDASAAKGDLDRARTFLDRAKKADPGHPRIAAAESRLTR